MCLLGGLTSVGVGPSERARVGLGTSHALVFVHVHVIIGLETFGPPLLDGLFGLASGASEHAFVMKHNYHMPAWLLMRGVVRATFGFSEIHFKGRTFGLRHVPHPVDVTTSGQNDVARTFRDLHLNAMQVVAVFRERMVLLGPLDHLPGVLGQLLPNPFQNHLVQVVGVTFARWYKDSVCAFHDLARFEVVVGDLFVVHGILVHFVVGNAFLVEVFGRNGALLMHLLELGLVFGSGWGLLQVPCRFFLKSLPGSFDLLFCIANHVFEAFANEGPKLFVEFVDAFLTVAVYDAFGKVS